ncbi:MAG: hypothetical protein HQL90_12830 [Magnetococcales bacterium]|nr:hypothetical protein [Magnetococcales bacterium]
MLIRLLKWILKQFAPYVAGILVGVGFFFMLIYFLPMLPTVSVLDWPTGLAQKEVALPVPTQVPQRVAPVSETVSPSATVDAAPAPAAAPSVAAPSVSAPSAAAPSAAAPSVAAPSVSAPSVAAPSVTMSAVGQGSQKAVSGGGGDPVLTDQEMGNMPAALATEQPIGAELDRDPVEMVPVTPTPPKTTAQESPAQRVVQNEPRPVAQNECGTAPMRPGPSMDQYLACQWRADCLNRLSRARQMIAQEKRGCPTVGNDAQSCLAYYHALEMQYHPSLCGGWSGAQMPGRW